MGARVDLGRNRLQRNLAEAEAASRQELIRAWFEAVNWWKENPEEGNKIVAKGLSWPIADVKLNQYGAIMLSLNQNMGAFKRLPGGKPLCESVPEEAPKPPAGIPKAGALCSMEKTASRDMQHQRGISSARPISRLALPKKG